MKKQLILLFFVLTTVVRLGAVPPPSGDYVNRKYGFSVAGSFGYSFFQVDKRHSEKASSLLGMGGMFRFHFFVRPNIHVQFGFEVLSQKCKFNTYYFADGHSQFYDNTFGYTHKLRTYELYVPVMARFGTSLQEANARSIFYFLAGYSPKMFLSATATVKQNDTGKDIWGGSTELSFENWFINEQVGNVVMGGIGIDKRIGWTDNFMSFELLYRYNFSRFIYYGNYNTNELLIRNSCLTFQIGYRFQ